MKIRCLYCDNYVSTSEKYCPNCGGENKGYINNISPKTINELNEICQKLDEEVLKLLSIGKPSNNKKTISIYKDDKDYLFKVYMIDEKGNKINRYDGKDEEYAVSEYYMKVKEIVLEIEKKKANESNENNVEKKKNKVRKNLILVFSIILLIVLCIFVLNVIYEQSYYYKYNDNYYYYNYSDNKYYVYLNDNSWEPIAGIDIGKEFYENSKKYAIKKPKNIDFEEGDIYKFTSYYYDDGYYFYENNYYYKNKGKWYKLKENKWKKIQIYEYKDLAAEFKKKTKNYKIEYKDDLNIPRIEDTNLIDIDDYHYYEYNDTCYQFYMGDWFIYKDKNWDVIYDVPDEIKYNYDQYRTWADSSCVDIESFRNSKFYER